MAIRDPFESLPARKTRVEQRDFSALAPPPSRIDKDGVPVPENWLTHKWEAMPLAWRKAYEPPKPLRPDSPSTGNGASRFTTQYAIEWGKKQGWKLIDRERYDARLKRHHDLMLGVDALFETPDGMVGVQGASKSERAAHYRRFEERGGIDRATRLHVGVVYLEFERGNKAPVVTEVWA